MPEGHQFRVTLSRQHAYAFAARFDRDDWAPLQLDEPPPIGDGEGPNPTRLLGAAVGNCLAVSLLFCLTKARVRVDDMEVTVEGTVARNDAGRLRVADLRVALAPVVPAEEQERMTRCLDLFEDFCIVTGSVRQGIPIHVQVTPVAKTGESEAS